MKRSGDEKFQNLSQKFPKHHKISGNFTSLVLWLTGSNAWWCLQLRAIEVRKEELKLRRLVNIARPLGVPELKPYQSAHGEHPDGTGLNWQLQESCFLKVSCFLNE